MNINNIYLGSVWTFKIKTTLKRKIVRLEPISTRTSIFYKNNGKYEELLNNKTLEIPKYIIMSGVILGNANKIEENKEYILPEYLTSFKEYIELLNLDIKEELSKKEILDIVKNEEFLAKIYKEEVENEKSI